MMLLTDIHVRSFTGSAMKPYLHSVAKLRMEVFREYPYFEEPDLDRETQTLRKVFSNRDSIVVLIFDNTTIVGSSIGYPLSLEEQSLLKPFKERQMDINLYYAFGDSVLLKAYRGRGIGHHFFDAREAHVSSCKKFKYICFSFPEHSETAPKAPKDFIPLSDFWRKRGYIPHPEMKGSLSWKTIGEPQPTEKQMIYWIKEIH